jgi:hypothetical protein
VGDLSNAFSFLGRDPFLSARLFRFCVKMPDAGEEAGKRHEASNNNNKASKQA